MRASRRLFVLLMAVAGGAGEADPAGGQWSYGADLAVRSRYEWRGLMRHEGWVIQPDAFVSYGAPGWLTIGTLGTIALGEPDRASFGSAFFDEINVWLEAGAPAGPFDLAAGWNGYFYELDGAVGSTLLLRDTHELYGRARLVDLPVVVPEVFLAYDIDARQHGYVETSVAIRVPLWNQVQIPIGSLFVIPRAGWSFGVETIVLAFQGSGSAESDFVANGLAHWGFSLRLPIGPLEWGPLTGSFSLAFHADWKEDAATRLLDSSGNERDHASWFELSFSMLGPRCRTGGDRCPNR